MATSKTPPQPTPTPPASPTPGLDKDGRLDDGTLRRLVFRTFGRSRRTQDSPVMPDVWLRYIRVAERGVDRPSLPHDAVDLLLTPWSGVRPGQIANDLRERLGRRGTSLLKNARVALSGSRVVVGAGFDALVGEVVPLTGWWSRLIRQAVQRRANETANNPEPATSKSSNRTKKTEEFDSFIKVFDEAFVRILERIDKRLPLVGGGINLEIARYCALVGFIDQLRQADSKVKRRLAALAYKLGAPAFDDDDDSNPSADGQTEASSERRRIDLDDAEIELLKDIYCSAKSLLRPRENRETTNGIFLISLNRSAAQSVFDSRATVKADAVARLFDVKATGIVFAVIDGGIDATHPGFLNEADEDLAEIEPHRRNTLKPFERLKHTRVKDTFDFTLLRDIVANATVLRDSKDDLQPDDPRLPEGPNRNLVIQLARNKANRKALEALANRIADARDLDWDIIRPLITVPHQLTAKDNTDDDTVPAPEAAGKYRLPGTDHGTHVAGILAGNQKNDPDSGRDLIGICPELSLYDLRVFDQNGRGDEFAILCAIEFVGWLNRDRANPVVHGVNLSLALAHDVDSFACGQTPICEACNHLVGAGTVVVVAAGNTGFDGGSAVEKQSLGSGYRQISITDPGNADSVITVGSTHRRDPHLYGVSYFSARGPTGDGRRKPDLLAPGEKITSLTPRKGSRRMDGTSMAAPHVAGAAALLMARYPELIGHPQRIKEILMNTATDLKREPSFQGAGLVDTLRALQSV
ncbi:MAG: S8 family serine peptidase [Verrucomicrobiales bacterium]|nr:S8 family serine peptidase [Verrucomicrobiales bacterium]